MLTLSTFATLFVSFTLAANASPSAQLAPDVGGVFAVYPGWDMDNGGATTFGGTELACLQACSASATCVAYAYVPYGGSNTGPGVAACNLKTAVTLSAFKTQPNDISVGLIGGCGTFAPVGPTRCFTVTVPA
ncbi:hypothetical protein DFH08DRAFT_1071727 [Mycena albidolilacea]|uniref:Apple domain-containing protein n=1 Tax=Mycena albidolilacea TaxID=1033008 RepID=A0AAD7AQS8_9AGAR|nr:hypothetical protein DFH08DRAFT_1071727 [Mycena albidolilacea]